MWFIIVLSKIRVNYPPSKKRGITDFENSCGEFETIGHPIEDDMKAAVTIEAFLIANGGSVAQQASVLSSANLGDDILLYTL